MGFAYFLEVIRKRWWLVAASVLLCTGSAYLLLSRTPTWYEATTTVRVPFSNYNANDFNTDPQQVGRMYQNLIREPAILEGAAQTVGLPYVPSPDKVSARLAPDSHLLEITVRDTDPEHARALADAIAQQLLLREEESRRARGQDVLQRLEERLRQTKEEIREETVRLDAADSAEAIQQHKGNIAALQEDLASLAASVSEVQTFVNEPMVIIEQLATMPTRPIRIPPVPETLLLVAVLGLILGLVGAFFMESRAGGRAKERESTAAGGGN